MYNGIREVDVTEEELAKFYEKNLEYDLNPNQYLLLKRDGVIVDRWKADSTGKIVRLVKSKTFDSQLTGRVKSRNIRQELYMDLLESEVPLTLVSGNAGVGKTFIATCYAIQELEKKKYDKILFLRNNVPIEGVGELGLLPGDTNEKLKGFFAYVSDILSPFMFESMLSSGKIEISWLGDMRGRNIANAIVICSEAQNLTTSLTKMIISRMGDNTRLIFDYDLDQIDKKCFDKDSGMRAIIDSLVGNPLFGIVELVDVERSELAKLASLIK